MPRLTEGIRRDVEVGEPPVNQKAEMAPKIGA